MNNKGKTNSATRLASEKGTRHYSKVLGSATTGNRTGLKLGLQQFNLKSYNQINPQCKSKNRNNSALFILTDQLITTSQNKWKEG